MKEVFRLAPAAPAFRLSISIFTASRSRALIGRCIPASSGGRARDRRTPSDAGLDRPPGRDTAAAGSRRRNRQGDPDVGRVAWLRHLAVVDDVETGGGLAADNVARPRFECACAARAARRESFLLREHHADEIFRTRQAPRVRRQEAIAAAFHWHDCGLWNPFDQQSARWTSPLGSRAASRLRGCS